MPPVGSRGLQAQADRAMRHELLLHMGGRLYGDAKLVLQQKVHLCWTQKQG